MNLYVKTEDNAPTTPIMIAYQGFSSIAATAAIDTPPANVAF